MKFKIVLSVIFLVTIAVLLKYYSGFDSVPFVQESEQVSDVVEAGEEYKNLSAEAKGIQKFPESILAELLEKPPISDCDEKYRVVNSQSIVQKALEVARTGVPLDDIYIALVGSKMQDVYKEFIHEYFFAGRPVIDNDKLLEIRQEQDLEKKFEKVPKNLLGGYVEKWNFGLTSALLPPAQTLEGVDIDFEFFNQLLKDKSIKPTPFDIAGFMPLPQTGPERRRQYLDGFKLIFDEVDFSEAHLMPGFYMNSIQRLVSIQRYDVIKYMVDRGLKMDAPSLQWNVADQMLVVAPRQGFRSENTVEYDVDKAVEFFRWLKSKSIKPSKHLVETLSNRTVLDGYTSKIKEFRDGFNVGPEHKELLKEMGVSADLELNFKALYEKYMECVSEYRLKNRKYRERFTGNAN